jgi:SAM-dependent methyltransferase
MSDRTVEEREYVLGTRSEELLRLGFQHQVWAPVTSALWQRAGFAPGHRLLDVGSGPGYATFDLAALAGATGHVLGVDVSRRFVDHLVAEAAARRISNVGAELQDVEGLTLPAGSLDGAFARWVLCFTTRPEQVVQAVAGALREGGTFAVMDYSNYTALDVAPYSPAVERVVHATAESVRRRGGSMDVGRDLPRMMRAAGLEVVHLAPIVRLARPGTALWKWPETFFFGYLPTLLEMELITEDDADAFRSVWRDRSADPDAFLTTPPMVEIIGRKSG